MKYVIIRGYPRTEKCFVWFILEKYAISKGFNVITMVMVNICDLQLGVNGLHNLSCLTTKIILITH